ncbi:MAG: xanthine dehydrogenase family protein molybdopterin-binding subunit [Planctomycetes bacterium]|nr:xanthine dehydrogenase family protein molybdopterin-binding subunit [Planctomycetota bacterium]
MTKKNYDREETLKLGFAGNVVEKKVKLADDQAKPWDLDTKFQYAGKHIPRFDGLAKASGRAKYSYDMNFPGMLHARIVRANIPNGKITDIDVSGAEAIPGVKATMLLKKVGDRVRFDGEGVAAVCATNLEIAEDAMRAVVVTYEKMAHAVIVDDASKDGAPIVDKGDTNKSPESVNINPREVSEDEINKRFAAADAKVEATYRTQVQTHSALETHGGVAKWDKDSSGNPTLTVWASTQGSFSVLDGLCGNLKLDRSQVEVICEYMGGGFGAKFGADQPTLVAANLAKKAGAPVKCMLNRKEEHLAGGNRPDSIHHVRAGATDGKIVVFDVTNYGTGGYTGGAGARNIMIYDMGASRKVEYAVKTNCGPATAMRAPGHPQGSFVLEQVVDELAEKLNMDPIEFRLKNDRYPMRKAQYEKAMELIDWSRRNKKGGEGALAGTGPKKRGLGVGASTWGQNGNRDGTAMAVIINADGGVEVRNGCQDIGTGTRTIIGICAAEALGCPLENMKVRLGHTRDPYGPASGGSVTAPTVTAAAKDAGHAAKLAFLDKISKKLSVDAAKLDISLGKVFVKDDPAKSWNWHDACKLLGVETVEVTKERSDNFRANFSGQVGGVQIAEVEVDTETGVVRVIKVVAVHDAGLVIDRLTFESQILGGVIQGMSFALFENRVMDRKSGKMLNNNLESYKIPGSLDMPEIVTVAFDISNGHNSAGVAGLGEPTVIPTAGAIANAIANATGVRVRSLPMTPDKVLAALAAKGGSR